MDNAMRYEELLCELFNCNQDGDELQLASATIYDSNISEIEQGKGFELRTGLFAALRKFQLTLDEREIDNFPIFWEKADYWIEIVFMTRKRSEIDEVITTIENLLAEIKKVK